MMAQKSVSKIYKDLGKDEAPEDGIGDAWLDDFSSESASNDYWKAADAYFELYLQYIYGDSWVSGKFEKKNTLDNGWSYNAQRDNTYTVVYTDENGVEKEINKEISQITNKPEELIVSEYQEKRGRPSKF